VVEVAPPEQKPGPLGPYVDLGRPAWQQVLALAGPALAQQWLLIAVNLSDRLLAGRFLRVPADVQAATQAAQTTANYLAWFLLSYAVLVSVGATTLVAHLTGAGDRKGAVRVTNQAVLLGFVLGLLGAAVGLASLPAVLGWLHLHGTAADLAEAYLRPLFLVLPIQMAGTAGVACLVGAGDTRTGLWVLGGVALLNLPLAWGFFHGVAPLPGLGFVGIAVGTALSQGLGGVVVLGVLLRGRAGLSLHARLLRPRWGLLRRILRISVPAAADSLSMAIGYLWFLGIVNALGDVAAAAHGIALTWEALAFQSGSAFGTAAIALVGQHLGAGRPERAARAGWMAFGLGTAVMLTMGVLFFILAVPMFHVFCPHASQDRIVEAGVPVLRLVAFGTPALASTMVLLYALRGAGDTRFPVLFTWLGFFVVRIPLAYLWTAEPPALAWAIAPEGGAGLFGAWLAMLADMYLRGLLVLGRWAGGRWRRMRV
jgi:putative MATE family efflux protein